MKKGGVATHNGSPNIYYVKMLRLKTEFLGFPYWHLVE
jgi:hypothetical protein